MAKAVRQLGSSGGNHFVSLAGSALQADNVLEFRRQLAALLSHSVHGGWCCHHCRTKHYSLLARDICRLPREAQHFAWLGLDTEEGRNTGLV